MSAKKLRSHKIVNFPKPFSFDKTPYTQLDFTDSVKSACSSASSVISGLRMCKVIILGDVNVGKTSIVNKFCRKVFSYSYKATIGVDFEVEQFDILNIPFNIQIWDTAGQERFRCIAAAYYRSAHVVVTVFDVTNITSLQHCLNWQNEALNSNVDTPLKFLVGTKKDLMKYSSFTEIENEAVKMANLMGAEFWVVSSRTGEGITDLFSRIAGLCFDKVVKIEYEGFNKYNHFNVGQSLLCLKKDSHTEKKECKLKRNCWG